jgi:hypothetical protein
MLLADLRAERYGWVLAGAAREIVTQEARLGDTRWMYVCSWASRPRLAQGRCRLDMFADCR